MLPLELQRILVGLHQSLDNLDYELRPYQRIILYNALNYKDNPFGQRVVSYLALLSAQKVLPIWQDALPKQTLPQQMLDMAQDFLMGKLDFDSTFHNAGNLWNIYGNKTEYLKVSTKIDCAGGSSLEALNIALKLPPFNNLRINSEVQDIDLKPGYGDAASSAVKAYSNVTYLDNTLYVDEELTLKFWKWWLTEAIPQAWQLAQETYHQP